MSITAETITELDNDIFNTLYNDSLTDMESGSMMFPSGLDDDGKKSHMKNMLEQNTMVLFKKDGTPCLYASGKKVDIYAFYENGAVNDIGEYDPTKPKHEFTNLFHWQHAIFGNVNGNKDWSRTEDFFTGMKEYLLTLSVSGYMIEPIKGKALDVSFKQSQANGVTLGTYTLNNTGQCSTLIWVY